MASFYFREEEFLSKKARQMAANVIAERVEKYRYRDDFLSLTQRALSELDWVVTLNALNIRLTPFAQETKMRADNVCRAE
ncbi:MAG: hypothetical protein KGL58_08845 [Pseudomonadota bacterium]|nr:hypothetical protein [Pseudomonadota bacterium]